MLTQVQQEKYDKLRKTYPDIFEKEKAMILSTVEIGECIDSRSQDVIRDLTRISKRLGNILSIQVMEQEKRTGKFFPINTPKIEGLVNHHKGGRRLGSTKEKGFKGTSHYIRLVLVNPIKK